MEKSIDEPIGQKFGKLTILKYTDTVRRKNRYLCQCECGKRITADIYNLRCGHTSSCGCVQRERSKESATTHGQSRSRIYNIRKKMIARCYRPNAARYERYGGRGIKICDEWLLDFTEFYRWSLENGYKEHLSIDRIDNDGDYEPSNCRWVALNDQANNTSRNISITHNGKTMSVAQWSKETGISYHVLLWRTKNGIQGSRLFQERLVKQS